MKKIIYGLFMLASMLCFTACNPEPASTPNDTAQDTQTLDGWYVATYNYSGQKLNTCMYHITGNKMSSYYYKNFSVSGDEMTVIYNEYLDDDILVDGVTFNDYIDDDGNPAGYDWEMITDENGTYLKCISDENWGLMNKVSGPDQTGDVSGEMNIYKNGNNFIVLWGIDEIRFGYQANDGWLVFEETTKNGNSFSPNFRFVHLNATVSNNVCKIEYEQNSSTNDKIPAGDYTLYTRTTPWNTINAE